MARVANPNKEAIDSLREEAKTVIKAIKENNAGAKALAKANAQNVKQMEKINKSLTKFDAAVVAIPDGLLGEPEKATKTAAPVKAAKTAAAPVKTPVKTVAAKPVVKTAKTAAAPAKPVTTAGKRGRPKAAAAEFVLE